MGVSIGGTSCVFIINFIFLIFPVFHGVGGVGGKFAISKYILRIGVSGAIILGEIIEGISAGCVINRAGVDCNIIITFLFLLFLVFLGVGEVGREFAISQSIWEIGVSEARILGGSIGG